MANLFLDNFDKMMLKEDFKQAWSDMIANGPDPKNFNHWIALQWAMYERGLCSYSNAFLLQPDTMSITVSSIAESFVNLFYLKFPYETYIENGKISSSFLGKNGVSYEKGYHVYTFDSDSESKKIGEGTKEFLINGVKNFSEYLKDDIAWHPSLQAIPLKPNTNRVEFLFYSDLKRFMQNVLTFLCKERYFLATVSGGSWIESNYNTFDYEQELDEKWNYPTLKAKNFGPDVNGFKNDFEFWIGETMLEAYIVKGWPIEIGYKWDSYRTDSNSMATAREVYFRVEKEEVNSNLLFGKGDTEKIFSYPHTQQAQDYWVVETDHDKHFNKFSGSQFFYDTEVFEIKYNGGLEGIIDIVNSLQSAYYYGTIDRKITTELKPSIQKLPFGKDDEKDYGQTMYSFIESRENYPFHYKNNGSLRYRDKSICYVTTQRWWYISSPGGSYSEPENRIWTHSEIDLDFTDVSSPDYIIRELSHPWNYIANITCNYNLNNCYLIESKKTTIPKKIKISVVEAKCCVEWIIGKTWNRKLVELPVTISYDECGYPEVNYDLRSVVKNTVGFSTPMLIHPEGLFLKEEYFNEDQDIVITKRGPYTNQTPIFSQKQYPTKLYEHRYEIVVPYITLIIDGNEEFVFKADGLQPPPEQPTE